MEHEEFLAGTIAAAVANFSGKTKEWLKPKDFFPPSRKPKNPRIERREYKQKVVEMKAAFRSRASVIIPAQNA